MRPAFFATCSALVAEDRDTGGVVPAVLQPPQPLDDDVEGGAGSDVSDDAAHACQGKRRASA